MSISQKNIDELLTSWQTCSIEERDKIILNGLFDHSVCENLSPMFSDNIKDNTATDNLIARLAELNYKFKLEKLPRSSLSRLHCNELVFPIMPAHKAVAFLGYVVAVSNSK